MMPVKKPTTKKQKKATVKKVMEEFKKGDLNIGKSSKKVKSRKQAVAIALSESGSSKKTKKRTTSPNKAKSPKKKNNGANWIAGAVEKPGALRKSLKVKKGKKIPVKKLEVAAKKKGKLGKRARLALTLRRLRK